MSYNISIKKKRNKHERQKVQGNQIYSPGIEVL